MEKIISERNAWIVIAVVIFVTGIITILFLANRTYSTDLPIDNALFGQYGDIIGGVVGTIFTLLGNLLLFYTINLQQNTIKLQQDSIILQQDGVKLQQESIRNQTSESSFNQLVTLICNQQVLLENKFKDVVIYNKNKSGLSDILDIDTFILQNSPINNSVFENIILNKTDKFIDFYNDSIVVLVCMIEKKDINDNFILFNYIERHNFYLLIKINFHVSEVIKLLAKGEHNISFRYEGLLTMLRSIESNGNQSSEIHNRSMKNP